MNNVIIPTEEEIVQFVRESNTIEGIVKPEDHPLFVDHVKSVEFTIKSTTMFPRMAVEPRVIHLILLASEPEKMPGQYRTMRVRIGPHAAPEPHLVPSLMLDLLIRALNKEPPQTHRSIESWIWDLHYEFECIHPLVDGNGRVGRIWMNGLRLLRGLPWITVYASEKHEYYERISQYRMNHPLYRQYYRDQMMNVETIGG